MKKFWSYDGIQVHLHDTAELAKNCCEDALAFERESAQDEGWSIDVQNIMWGEVYEAVTEAKDADVECSCNDPGYDYWGHANGCRRQDPKDYYLDYALKSTKEDNS